MAIALETFSGTGADFGSGVPVTVPAPSGINEGNLLLTCLTRSGTSSAATSITGSGWTVAEFFSGSYPSAILWKIATGSEPSSYSFNSAPPTDLDQFVAHISRWSGVDTESPILVAPAVQNSTTGNNLVAPSITIPSGVDGAVLVTHLIGKRYTDPPPNPGVNTPSGMTAVQGIGGAWSRMGSSYQSVSSGATGTRSATLVGGDPEAQARRGISLALRPADGDPEPPSGPEPGRFFLAV